MKRFLLVMIMFSLIAAPAFSTEIVKKENLSLDLEGFFHAFWKIDKVNDPYRSDVRAFFFIPRSRFVVKGNYEGVKYRMEIGFSGREGSQIDIDHDWGINPTLLDFYADVPFPGSKSVYLRVGQFKTPFGRENLSYSRYLTFTQRSINQLFLGMGRDFGGALLINPRGPWSFVLAIQTALGRNIPERYLPEKLGIPLTTVRFGYNNGADGSILSPYPGAIKVDKPKFAFYLNYLYTKDTLAGHSTALNVRRADKPLFLNGSWNPYIGRWPFAAGKLSMYGGDFVLRLPASKGSFSIEGELDYGKFSNDYGKISTYGGRIQGNYLWKNIEVALRYAFIKPDKAFASNITPSIPEPIGNKAIQEIVPSFVYYYKKQNAKLIVEIPVFINTPVLTEEGLGTYVVLDQPDTISYIGNPANKIERKTVPGLQIILQVGF